MGGGRTADCGSRERPGGGDTANSLKNGGRRRGKGLLLGQIKKKRGDLGREPVRQASASPGEMCGKGGGDGLSDQKYKASARVRENGGPERPATTIREASFFSPDPRRENSSSSTNRLGEDWWGKTESLSVHKNSLDLTSRTQPKPKGDLTKGGKVLSRNTSWGDDF